MISNSGYESNPNFGRDGQLPEIDLLRVVVVSHYMPPRTSDLKRALVKYEDLV